MTKHLQIKNSVYERLTLGKFNKSYSDIIENALNDVETQHREIGLLKQEIGLLKLKLEKDK